MHYTSYSIAALGGADENESLQLPYVNWITIDCGIGDNEKQGKKK